MGETNTDTDTNTAENADTDMNTATHTDTNTKKFILQVKTHSRDSLTEVMPTYFLNAHHDNGREQEECNTVYKAM